VHVARNSKGTVKIDVFLDTEKSGLEDSRAI
jgi:hypothetical protein